jgi:AraC-like DNA-binding protein
MRSAAKLELKRYSTADLPPADRHEAWINRDWPSLAPVYRTTPLEPFDTVSDRLRLGDLVVHYSSITAQRWERDAAMRRSCDSDSLTVAITLAGEARGIMGERAFRTGAGSVMLSDLSQTSSHESTASRTILLALPRAVATEAGLKVAELHGAVLRSSAAAMLGPHLMGLRKAVPELMEEDGPLLARSVLDLLGLAVATSGRVGAAPALGRGAAELAARWAIERELGSPRLTIANLCRRLQVSRTTLHRLFETEGGVQAYIRGRRLEAVRRALSDVAGDEPIYALAERLGFSDAAHLSRLFRARYGLTPSDYRAKARDERGADPPAR